VITPANFATFVTNINTMIGQVYATDPVDSYYKKICTELPVQSKIWEAGWTGLMPKMRVWFGMRQPHQPNAQTYQVNMIPYENTYEIDRFDLDDDQFGIYYRMLPDMARQAQRQPDYETRDLIEGNGVFGGSRQNGFDGLTHWNTAHPIDVYDASKGTYTNDTTGGQTVGSTTVGGAIGEVALATIFEYGMTIKGEDGERLGVKYDTLMHPPTMRVTIELLLKSMFFAPPTWGGFAPVTSQVGAADNPLKRLGVTPLQNDFLSSNTKYFLLDTTKPMKPFLWLNREATRTVPRINENDPNVFDRHVFQWGQWNRKSPAWSYAFLSHRSGT